MKDFPSLKEFLSNYDLSTIGRERMAELKHHYRKSYHHEYNRRRTKASVITLRMTPREFESTVSLSHQYGYKSTNAFIKGLIKKYAQLKLIVPHPAKKQDTINAINKIGSNINQTIKRLNREFLRSHKSQAFPSQYEHLYRLLNGYEELQNQIVLLTQVINASHQVNFDFIGISWNEIKDNKDGKLDQLISYLTEHKEKIDANT